MADNYSFEIQTNDTLYYIVSKKMFIVGMNNLLGYYAWGLGNEPSAPADYSNFTSSTTDAVQVAKDTNDLLAYVEGQCWYRIFIQDPNGSAADQNAVRRNHIYVVDIATIKGPGIADPRVK